MTTQRLGTAQLMFVRDGQSIVLDAMLTVSGAEHLVMPATFVLSIEPRSLAARRRRIALSRWVAAGAVCTTSVIHLDGHPFITFSAGGYRLSFRLAGCVSQPRLVIAAADA